MGDWDKLNNEEQQRWCDQMVDLINSGSDSCIDIWNEYCDDFQINRITEDGLNDFFIGDLPSTIVSFVMSNFPADYDEYRYFAYNSEDKIEFFNSLGEFSEFDPTDYSGMALFAYESNYDEEILFAELRNRTDMSTEELECAIDEIMAKLENIAFEEKD